MAGRSTNTMSEFVDRQLADWGQAAGLPDADDQLISAIQQLLVAYKRKPIEALNASGLTNARPSPSMQQMSPGVQPGGPMMGPGMPNPDELRRLMS